MFFKFLSMIMEREFGDMVLMLCKGNIGIDCYLIEYPFLIMKIVLTQPLIKIRF